MVSIGNILLEKEILLESGTNEVEILVFRVGSFSLGINVAKVREVLPSQKITHLPQTHDSIEGCFTLRDQVVPCVSLHQHLGENAANESDELTIILTEFNQYQTAFVVDSVERIHRVSWKNVLAAPSIINNTDTPVTAVTTIEERLILMLDFEMIADQVSEKSHRTSAVENTQNLPRHELRILLADDSATVREAAAETLRSSGYTNLTTFENGEETWNWIQQRLGETGDIEQIADLLISDVEMPQIDGFHLTKNIKEHPELRKMCVLLYSSILTPDNRNKGAAVKADGMITKPELSKLVSLADELIVKKASQREGTAVPKKAPVAIPEPSVGKARPAAEAAKAIKVTEKSSPTTESITVKADSSTDTVIGSRLWYTFRNELTERVELLSELCQAASEGELTEDMVNDAFRVLHSIKSAAMVAPVDEVTQLTHLAENIMEVVRQKKDRWPHAEMNKYTEWLRKLADPSNDEEEVRAVLATSNHLEKEIT